LVILHLSIFFTALLKTNEISWNKEIAYSYLQNSWNENGFQSMISTSKMMEIYEIGPSEIFSTILILDLLQNHVDLTFKKGAIDYVKENIGSQVIHFFEDHALLPADVDCTSLGVVALAEGLGKDHKEALVKQIAANITDEGVIKVYFNGDESRNHIIDPVVCANALYAIYTHDNSLDVSKTENFLYSVLVSEQYINGTRYYPSPATFLWATSRLLNFESFRTKFLDIFQEKINKLIGTIDNSLDLSLYILAAKNAGLSTTEEKKKLAALQRQDGSWAPYAFFKYGKKLKYFGSSYITTAFAICALK
jgi:hypothetical protein